MEKREEWESLLKDLHNESYLWCLSCCNRDKEMAKDVLQTVYLKIYEGKAVFSGKAKFKTWLFSIIKYTTIDQLRKQGLRAEKLDAELQVESAQENELNERERSFWFSKVLNKLSAQQREVLTLAFYHDLTLEEISLLLKISLGTARTHYERGKENFKKYLSHYRLDTEFLEK